MLGPLFAGQELQSGGIYLDHLVPCPYDCYTYSKSGFSICGLYRW